jgi:hypothetical protein
VLSHYDETFARQFFAVNPDEFGAWVHAEDDDTDHFFGAAEAAAAFVALCGAIKSVNAVLDNIDKIVKRAKTLTRFARKLLVGKEQIETPAELSLGERALILVYDNYMCTKRGIATDRLVALLGTGREETEEVMKRLKDSGAIKEGKTGWRVAR